MYMQGPAEYGYIFGEERLVAAAPDNNQQDEKNQNQSEAVEFSIKDAAHRINILLICVLSLLCLHLQHMGDRIGPNRASAHF